MLDHGGVVDDADHLQRGDCVLYGVPGTVGKHTAMFVGRKSVLRALEVLMSARTPGLPRAVRRGVALAVALLACPAGAAQAAIAHPGARDLARGPDHAAIRDPGDRDWFVLEGMDAGVAVTFRTVDVPVACSAPTALRVGFYSPEGHFIRRIDPGTDGVYRVGSPAYPGRYLVKVTADPACTSLGYIAGISVGASVLAVVYDAHADLCAGLEGNVRLARRLLKRMRAKARAVSRSARPRYRRLVRWREDQLAVARAAYVKQKCTTPT